jgi:MFS transporter, MCT family, solute carrier family 16 (monocarboxylic acid transporters), member 3
MASDQWATRVSAFVALFICIVGGLCLRPRKIPKSTGPIFDWQAFKDATFSIYSAGAFLIFFSVFTMLLYVSRFLPLTRACVGTLGV